MSEPIPGIVPICHAVIFCERVVYTDDGSIVTLHHLLNDIGSTRFPCTIKGFSIYIECTGRGVVPHKVIVYDAATGQTRAECFSEVSFENEPRRVQRIILPIDRMRIEAPTDLIVEVESHGTIWAERRLTIHRME